MKKRGDFGSNEEWLEYFEQLTEDDAPVEDLMESAEGIDEEALLKAVKENDRRKRMSGAFQYAGRKRGFLIIPDEFSYSGRHLTHGEKWTWLALFLHDWRPDGQRWRCFPSIERLAIIIGKSTRQVKDYLAGLKKKEVLQALRRVNRTNFYILHDPPKEWMEETKRKLKELEVKKLRQKQQRLEAEKERILELSQRVGQDTSPPVGQKTSPRVGRETAPLNRMN